MVRGAAVSIVVLALCFTNMFAGSGQTQPLDEIASGVCVVNGKAVDVELLNLAIDVVDTVDRAHGALPTALNMAPLDQMVAEELANPKLDEKTLRLYQQAVSDELKSNLPEIEKAEACVYVQHYSRSELLQLRTFYQSPLGQKVMANEIPITSEFVELGRAFLRTKIGLAATQRAKVKLRAQGVKI